MNDLITLHIFAEDYPPTQYWRLVEWCKQQGADEWTATAVRTQKGRKAHTKVFDRFETLTAPFRLANAPRRHLTCSRSNPFVRPLELWRLTSKSLDALKEFFPDGVFKDQTAGEGGYEDLILYRRGELMLGVVSHESEGVLRVTSEERQSLEREGFPFRISGRYVGY